MSDSPDGPAGEARDDSMRAIETAADTTATTATLDSAQGDAADSPGDVPAEAEAAASTTVGAVASVEPAVEVDAGDGNGTNGAGANGNGANGNGSNGNGDAAGKASRQSVTAIASERSDTKVLSLITTAPLPPPPPWAKVGAEVSGTEARSRRWPKVVAIVGGVAVFLVAAILLFDWTQRNNILPGVSVDGVDVGGLSRGDALDLVDEESDVALSQVVAGQADGETHKVTLVDLGVRADVDAAVSNAVAARETQADEPEGFRLAAVTGPFVRTYHRLLNKPVDVEVELSYSVDPATRDGWVNGVKAAMDRAPVDARIDVSTGQFQILPSAVGRQLDSVALTQLVDANARDWALASFGADGAGEEIAFDLPVAIIPPAVTEENIGITIFVNRSERRLYHYAGKDLVKTYEVAVGTPGHPTPKGEFKIVEKRKNPTWVNPAPSGWGAGMPKSIPPGPSNPLGLRALNLNASGIRIHGTNNTGSLGSAASHGCIRMANDQIVEFFELIPVDTRVIII